MGDSWLETDGSRAEQVETMSATRVERDPLGELPVPADALYGVQTQRAVLNFPISGMRPWRAFIWSVGLVKRAAW